MKRFEIRLCLVAACLVGSTLGVVAPAEAATSTGIQRAGTTSTGTVTPNTLSTVCTYGSEADYGENWLTNGHLEALGCSYSPYSTTIHNVSQININYDKKYGASVTLRFFWEWTDPNGRTSYGRRWDNGAFVASAGHSYSFIWGYRPPGIFNPNSTATCIRGGLQDQTHNASYTTSVMCLI